VTSHPWRIGSGELVHAEAEAVSLAVGQELFPGDFFAGEACHAAEHAAQCGFNAGGNLVVAVAGGDALNEGAFLVAVGEFQIVAEGSVGGKLAGAWR